VHDDELPYFNNFYDHLDIGHQAMRAVEAQGIEHGTPAFHQAVKRNFESRMHPTPEMPEPEQVELPARASMVSAPVSRDTVATGSYNSYGDRLGRVTLSVAQKEAARISGISDREYAEQLLRLREEKANGNYHGGQP